MGAVALTLSPGEGVLVVGGRVISHSEEVRSSSGVGPPLMGETIFIEAKRGGGAATVLVHPPSAHTVHIPLGHGNQVRCKAESVVCCSSRVAVRSERGTNFLSLHGEDGGWAILHAPTPPRAIAVAPASGRVQVNADHLLAYSGSVEPYRAVGENRILECGLILQCSDRHGKAWLA